MNKLLEEYLALERKLFEGRKTISWSDDQEAKLQQSLADMFGSLTDLDRAKIENQRDVRRTKREVLGLYWSRQDTKTPIQLGQVVFHNAELGLIYRASSFEPIRDDFLEYATFLQGDHLPSNYWRLPQPIVASDPTVRFATLVASSDFLTAMPQTYSNEMLRLDGAEGWTFAVGTIGELGRRLYAWIRYLQNRRAGAFANVPTLLQPKQLIDYLDRGVTKDVDMAFPGVGHEIAKTRDLMQRRLSMPRSGGASRLTWGLAVG